MNPSASVELRKEVRLKLVLARGTGLAEAYLRPEVQRRTLQCYDDLLDHTPQLAAARKDYLSTIADSYRVLRAGAGYAALESMTSDEHAEEFAKRLLRSAEGFESLPGVVTDALRSCCAALAGLVAPRQRMLAGFVDVARQRGVIDATSDPALHDELTRAELPSADDYRRHVFGLLEGRVEVAFRIVHALEAVDPPWRGSAERMRDSVGGDAIALREVLRWDAERRVKRLYPA